MEVIKSYKSNFLGIHLMFPCPVKNYTSQIPINTLLKTFNCVQEA